MSEIIFLAVLALIVIGPKQLPELARTIGRFMNELKRSTNVLSDELKTHTHIDKINFNEPLSRFDGKSTAQRDEEPQYHHPDTQINQEPQQMDLIEQQSPEGEKKKS